MVMLFAGDVREAAPDTYASFVVSHVVFGGGMLVAGLHLPTIHGALRSRWGKRSLGVAALTSALTVIIASWLNPAGALIPWYLLGILKPSTETGATFHYIFVSDHLGIAALLLLSEVRSFWAKAGVASVATVLLFWASSRSALGFFMVVACVIVLRHWWRLRFWPRLVVAATGAVIIAALALTLTPIIREVGVVPELERFDVTNLSADRSLEERQELLTVGKAQLQEDWVVGHFMREVLEGREGNYIHNVLSFWQAYGFGPFLLLVALALPLLVRVTLAYARSPGREDLEFCFALAWFGCLSLAFTRSYGTNWVWLMLGGVPAVLGRRRFEGSAAATPPAGVAHSHPSS
jgi:hypothetical protein